MAGAYGFMGAMDYSDAIVQEAMEKEARPARAIAADIKLSYPLEYKAVVCQRGKYADRPTCRFYARREIETSSSSPNSLRAASLRGDEK